AEVEGDRPTGSEKTGDVAEETTGEHAVGHPSGYVEVHTDGVKTAVAAADVSKGIFDEDLDIRQRIQTEVVAGEPSDGCVVLDAENGQRPPAAGHEGSDGAAPPGGGQGPFRADKGGHGGPDVGDMGLVPPHRFNDTAPA